jgi:hypothetical protein
MCKRLFCALGLLLWLHSAQAQQKLSIDKVYSVTLRNSGPVIENEEIKGYYFFYLSDKVDKKTNEYTLQILDANLNKLKDIKFEDSKKIVLLESSFNGSFMVFLFYDDEQNMLDYRLYNMDGKKTYSYSKLLDKKTEGYLKETLKAMSANEEADNQNVFDIPEKGFISAIPVKEGRNFSFEVNFYSSDKRKTWAYNPIEEERISTAHYLGANDSVALFEVFKREKMMSMEGEVYLLGLNLANGKKTFETLLSYKGHKLLPMNISRLQGRNEYIVMGPYFNGADQVMKDKSLGVGVWVMNSQGQVLAAKSNSWTGDIGKFLKTDQKGRVADIGYVFFHSLLQTEDGSVFAVGEGYKKVASALGIASAVLTRSYSGVAKMKITDMVLLKLNSQFGVEDAKVFDKYNNSVELPGGAEFMTPQKVALWLKGLGYFDYSFTLPGKNHASFMSGYTDYERSKDYKGLTFNSISYYNGQVTTDKINLKTTASSMRILPAKPGSVLILEYFRKDKRIDLRMEKMN